LRITEIIKRLVRDESGQDLIEYGLLALFISIVAIVTLKLIAPLIAPFYQAITNALTP
jgi:Flp pilus assembly pilin Flp